MFIDCSVNRGMTLKIPFLFQRVYYFGGPIVPLNQDNDNGDVIPWIFRDTPILVISLFTITVFSANEE